MHHIKKTEKDFFLIEYEKVESDDDFIDNGSLEEILEAPLVTDLSILKRTSERFPYNILYNRRYYYDRLAGGVSPSDEEKNKIPKSYRKKNDSLLTSRLKGTSKTTVAFDKPDEKQKECKCTAGSSKGHTIFNLLKHFKSKHDEQKNTKKINSKTSLDKTFTATSKTSNCSCKQNDIYEKNESHLGTYKYL